MVEPAAQVFAEGAHAAIAFAWRLAQRLGGHRFEVAAGLLGVFGAARAEWVVRQGQGLGQAQRPAVQHGMFGLCAAGAARPQRQLAAGQFEQHHTQRKHIGRGANGLAGDLLRRGVVRRQAAAGMACDVAGRRRPPAVVIEQTGDAEVQQLGLAARGDQHVGRLQVAVHDELRVGVLHRFGHPHQQTHALGQRRVLGTYMVG